MIKVDVHVENIEGFDVQFREVIDAVNANLEQVAEYVFNDAKNTSEFIDRTKKLRKSIKLRKSKYQDGGWIIVAKNPGWLVEYGHIQIPPGDLPGRRVPPHPFMRPAKEKGIRYAVALLRSNK